MASLDEFNPGRWEAEDEDFLDREDNYVLQKSTNTLVTNVTAKTRRSRDQQRINGNSSKSSKMSRQSSSGRREPPSFASARSLRKTSSSKTNRPVPGNNNRKRQSSASSSSRPTPTKQASAPTRTPAPPRPTPKSLKKEKSDPVVSSSKQTPSSMTAPPKQSSKRLPGLLGLASVSEDERSDDEESLDIKQVFPALDESPKPPDPNDRHWKSQQIYIPVRQEKWNEASVMVLHQSMMGVPRHYHAAESPYMKDPDGFDDDDKSLGIEEVFPVLAKSTSKSSNHKEPPLVEAAKKAAASKRRIVQLQQKQKAKTAAAASNKDSKSEDKGPPLLDTAASKRRLEAAKKANASRDLPPRDIPSGKPPVAPPAKVAPIMEEKGSQDLSTSSTDGKKGYQLPTYVRRPSTSNEDLHGSDELTMDSALMQSSSNQNLKEQQEEQEAEEQRRAAQQLDEELRAAEARRLERKRLKKEKSKRSKKHKKKKTKRRLEEDNNSVESQRERESSMGPESMMEHEAATEAAERERRRLKKERKEKKKRKKKKHKRTTQSERHLSTQPKEGAVRLSTSLRDIEESVSSSPDGTPPKMSVSQPAITSSKSALDNYLGERESKSGSQRGSRRSLQSRNTKSSRRSDSKRTTMSDGHNVRSKSRDDDDDDGDLDAYLRDGKKPPSSSKRSVRSDSHTTVKKSNVANARQDHPSSLRIQQNEPKLDQDSFMRSAAAGMLYESEDSMSPGAAAAARSRVRSARAGSQRTSGRNSALKPATSMKEPFDKNVSSTWQQSSTSLSRLSRDPLKSNASTLQQKSKPSFRSSASQPSTRPDPMDNERMRSVGNFDMVSAVDAAVAAKKHETGNFPEVAEKKKKKKNVLKRLFGGKKKTNANTDRSAPLQTRSVDAVPQSRDQEELNEYLSSSKSSWYASNAEEKKEHSSAPSSPVVDLPKDGGFKDALGTPPAERLRR